MIDDLPKQLLLNPAGRAGEEPPKACPALFDDLVVIAFGLLGAQVDHAQHQHGQDEPPGVGNQSNDEGKCKESDPRGSKRVIY